MTKKNLDQIRLKKWKDAEQDKGFTADIVMPNKKNFGKALFAMSMVLISKAKRKIF